MTNQHLERHLDWRLFATELAMISNFLTIIGAIQELIYYSSKSTTYGQNQSTIKLISLITTIPLCLFSHYFIEFYRGKSMHDKTLPIRSKLPLNNPNCCKSSNFEKFIEKLHNRKLPFLQNFLFRAVYYLILSIFCFPNMFTHLGCYTYFISFLLYLICYFPNLTNRIIKSFDTFRATNTMIRVKPPVPAAAFTNKSQGVKVNKNSITFFEHNVLEGSTEVTAESDIHVDDFSYLSDPIALSDRTPKNLTSTRPKKVDFRKQVSSESAINAEKPVKVPKRMITSLNRNFFRSKKW